jgi:MFS transporter
VTVSEMNRTDEHATACRPPGQVYPQVRTSPLLIAVLAALNAVAPFSIDMYLSAFPQMAHDFHASTSSIQLTLIAFLIGLASGQLILGQVSNRFGRRPPLIIGSAICLGASALCVFAPSVELLICLRFVQGFSGAAGVVIARAVIADRAHGRVAVQLFSTMTFTAVLAPMVAPLLGGAVVTDVGWRAVFVTLAVTNLWALLGVLLFVDESLPEHRRRPSGLKALAASTCSGLDVFPSCPVAVAAGSAIARLTARTIAPRRVLVGGVIAAGDDQCPHPRDGRDRRSAALADDCADGPLHGGYRLPLRPFRNARNDRSPPHCRYRIGDLGIRAIHGRCARLTVGGRVRSQQRSTDGHRDVLCQRGGSSLARRRERRRHSHTSVAGALYAPHFRVESSETSCRAPFLGLTLNARRLPRVYS